MEEKLVVEEELRRLREQATEAFYQDEATSRINERMKSYPQAMGMNREQRRAYERQTKKATRKAAK
jgi:hypothetical protein